MISVYKTPIHDTRLPGENKITLVVENDCDYSACSESTILAIAKKMQSKPLCKPTNPTMRGPCWVDITNHGSTFCAVFVCD